MGGVCAKSSEAVTVEAMMPDYCSKEPVVDAKTIVSGLDMDQPTPRHPFCTQGLLSRTWYD
jgi:hypothetical protein